MTTIKTEELVGMALDWAVAIAEGIPAEDLFAQKWSASLFRRTRDEDGNLNGRYMTGPGLLFSRKWEAGGPIIEREGITLEKFKGGSMWSAFMFYTGDCEIKAPTPLIAAMRCYVASKLGDAVEVPEELLK